MFGCVSAGRSTPAFVRERLSAALGQGLLVKPPVGVDEIMLLSTCHRVELYATGGPDLPATLRQMLSVTEADDVVCLRDADAIHHLFRVTAGLDSLVVGERQIQGQVRRALKDARAHQAARRVLTTLTDRALRAGRRARSKTSLGAIGESIGTATALLIQDRIGSLTNSHGVIVGAGSAAEDAATALRARGANLTIVSRTDAHAHSLARLLDSTWAPLNELLTLLSGAQFVVVAVSGGELLTSTTSNTPVLVDLSSPHAIAPHLGAVTVDTLPAPSGALVERGVAEASMLIQQELDETLEWIISRRDPRWSHLIPNRTPS